MSCRGFLAVAALVGGLVVLCRSAQPTLQALAAANAAHAREPAAPPPAVMKWVDFNGPALPRNGSGEQYPSQYEGEGGRARISLDDTDAVAGRSVRFEVTKGTLYAHFNPYEQNGTRRFARHYVAEPGKWRWNTYNRLSFWIKAPANGFRLLETGQENVQVGTYVKRVKDPDARSDEAGGDHGYHHFNVAPTGTWTKIVMNMHPSHFRGQPGGKEHGNQPHPTREPEYNYFDALTRLYIDASRGPPASYPAVYHLDEFEFYQEPCEENDEQVYSIAATYVPGTKELILTWSRSKNEEDVRHEVRYAFANIHQLGWEKATPAPDGVVKALGTGGYNGMLYRSTKLPLAGKAVVYLAIKPENATRFSQIALPGVSLTERRK
jgi:hypothetical protein